MFWLRDAVTERNGVELTEFELRRLVPSEQGEAVLRESGLEGVVEDGAVLGFDEPLDTGAVPICFVRRKKEYDEGLDEWSVGWSKLPPREFPESVVIASERMGGIAGVVAAARKAFDALQGSTLAFVDYSLTGWRSRWVPAKKAYGDYRGRTVGVQIEMQDHPRLVYLSIRNKQDGRRSSGISISTASGVADETWNEPAAIELELWQDLQEFVRRVK
jgi:hypothetical protein